MTETAKAPPPRLQDAMKTGIPSPISDANQRDNMPLSGKEYEFFVTTNKPHHPEGTNRGLIRRLVMRNFFDAKEAGPQTTSSEHNSASTVLAKKQLKSRFRLSKMGKEKVGASCRKKNSEENGTTARRREKALRNLSGITNPSGMAEKSAGLVDSPTGLLTDDHRGPEHGVAKRRDQRIVLRISPSAHRFDPFDVLPVPGYPQLDTLFKLYKSGSKKNSIAANPKHTWWSFISNDAGLLHATLATWALYGMLVQGLTALRVDGLRHKNEAIKEINMKIGSPGGSITDELIGTVLTMASFENLIGAYDAAQLHIAALRLMVNARDGLFAFGHNDGLIRGIIWVDFHTATAFHTPPSFPQICLDPDTPLLPEKLLEEATCTSPTTLLQLSIAGIDCFNIFYRLHRLGLAASSHWINDVDRLTLSNLLYELEYIVLSVPDYSRTFLEFYRDATNDHEEDYLIRENAAHAASVVEALLAAAQIFIFAALRDVPTKAKIFAILLERLRVAVARPLVCTINVWKKERNINMLLWTLIVACSIAPAGGARKWWIDQLVELMTEMEVKSRFDLEVALQSVAWVDTYFNGVLVGIWEDVSQQRRARVEHWRPGTVVDVGERMWEVQMSGEWYV